MSLPRRAALAATALLAVPVTGFVSAYVRSAVDDAQAPAVPGGRYSRPSSWTLAGLRAYARDMADIVIQGKPRKTLTVDLVGEGYKVRVPKAAVSVFLAKDLQSSGDDPEKLQESLARWARVLLGKENGAKVIERMRSASDDLDIPDLVDLITAVMEAGGGNPTTSPSAS